MAKLKSSYVCSECGYRSVKWLGRCSDCGNYNTMEEQAPSAAPKIGAPAGLARKIGEIETTTENRCCTGINELNRVLSGGFVSGSVTLIGGEPGAGKSTLLLQVCQNIGQMGKKILYASGEESAKQIKLRADRLSVITDNLYVIAETDLNIILSTAEELKPDFLIVDSIQTVHNAATESAAGSQTQVRDCAAMLMKLAKGRGVTVILVGHVTKEGGLAGPKILEHMVDTVLYFEGERQLLYRLIRAYKNRFGTTNEIGMFEMKEEGLCEISNPSEYMLSGRPVNASGSVVTAAMEGSRPILTEAQALVSPTPFGTPRRLSSGADYNRVIMIAAAIEKRTGLRLSDRDIYINIAGGLKITEPAVDAAIAAAIISSHRNKVIGQHTLIFGEAGLSGEIRAVHNMAERLQEGVKLGFTTCIMPESGLKSVKRPQGIELFGIRNLIELLEIL